MPLKYFLFLPDRFMGLLRDVKREILTIIAVILTVLLAKPLCGSFFQDKQDGLEVDYVGIARPFGRLSSPRSKLLFNVYL
jgi:hypothetical protein